MAIFSNSACPISTIARPVRPRASILSRSPCAPPSARGRPPPEPWRAFFWPAPSSRICGQPAHVCWKDRADRSCACPDPCQSRQPRPLAEPSRLPPLSGWSALLFFPLLPLSDAAIAPPRIHVAPRPERLIRPVLEIMARGLVSSVERWMEPSPFAISPDTTHSTRSFLFLSTAFAVCLVRVVQRRANVLREPASCGSKEESSRPIRAQYQSVEFAAPPREVNSSTD